MDFQFIIFFKFYCPMSIIWDLEQSCSSLRTAGFRFQRRQHSSGKLKEVIQVHNQSFLSASQADKGCRVVGVDPVAVQIVDSHFSPVLVSALCRGFVSQLWSSALSWRCVHLRLCGVVLSKGEG